LPPKYAAQDHREYKFASDRSEYLTRAKTFI